MAALPPVTLLPPRASLRVDGRAFTGTWSQVGDEDDARALALIIVARVLDIFDSVFYTVGCEEHADGNWHVHLGVLRERGCKAVKIGQRLDVDGRLVSLSPHRGDPRSLRTALVYPTKEDLDVIKNWTIDEIDDLFVEPANAASTPKDRRDEAFAKALQADSHAEAMLAIREGAPSEFVLQFDKINTFFDKKFAPAFEKKYDVSDFVVPLVDWDTVNVRASIVLVGANNLGKTHYALAHFERPFLCNHVDLLRGFNPSIHDGIVFDEISMVMWPTQALISVFDRELPRAIQVRYAIVKIPAGTRKIFCCNSLDTAFLPKDCDFDEPLVKALQSRQHIVAVNDPLF